MHFKDTLSNTFYVWYFYRSRIIESGTNVRQYGEREEEKVWIAMTDSPFGDAPLELTPDRVKRISYEQYRPVEIWYTWLRK